MRVLRGDGPAVLAMERRILLIQVADRTEQLKQGLRISVWGLHRAVPPFLHKQLDCDRCESAKYYRGA